MTVGVQFSSGNSAPNSGNNRHLTVPFEGGMHSLKRQGACVSEGLRVRIYRVCVCVCIGGTEGTDIQDVCIGGTEGTDIQGACVSGGLKVRIYRVRVYRGD